jgi:hypothetical protein
MRTVEAALAVVTIPIGGAALEVATFLIKVVLISIVLVITSILWFGRLVNNTGSRNTSFKTGQRL